MRASPHGCSAGTTTATGCARLRRCRWSLSADAVEGRDLTCCLVALGEMAVRLSPSPLPDLPRLVEAVAGDFTRWDTLAADVPNDLDRWATERWPFELAAPAATALEAIDGVALVHSDVRADNLLLADGRVVVVDWPMASPGRHGSTASPWCSTRRLLGEHDPEALLNRTPRARCR